MATVSKPTKAFSDIVAHTRGSEATYIDSTGSIVTVGPDTPRTNHHVYDGVEWVNAGLLIEGEDRTNLIVGSASPATQDITISTIAPHTLHFTGDGSVSLSGVYTGSLSGTGTGEENRVSLIFTPDSTGTLTVTVTGTVTNSQLELGESPSSYIETTTTPVTRYRDNFTVYPESLPDLSSTNGATIQMSGRMNHTNSDETVFYRWYEDESNQFAATLDQSSGTVTFTHSGDDSVSGTNALVDGSSFSIGGVFTDSRVAGAVNGVLTGENTAPTSAPSLNSTGVFELGHQFMGTMSSLRVWGEDVGDTGLVGVAPSLPPLLLDVYPGAAAAYSLRSLTKTRLNQPVIRVRRSSDNTEQDFTAEQVTDGTLAGFCGTGDGLVTTWYDQSGNGNDAVQNQAPDLPRIVISGSVVQFNGKPAVEYTSNLEALYVNVSGLSGKVGYLVGSALRYQEVVVYDTTESGAKTAIADYYGFEPNEIDGGLSVALALNYTGAPVAGGYFAGLIDTLTGNIIAADDYQTGLRYALIVSDKSLEGGIGSSPASGLPTGNLAWDTQDRGGEAGCFTRWNGLDATNVIIAKNDTSYEVHDFIEAVRSQYPAVATPGGSEWYLPAMDELELLYRNFKPNNADKLLDTDSENFPGTHVTGTNPSSAIEGFPYENSPRIPDVTFLDLFKQGNAQSLDQTEYWSTTDADESSYAWRQFFNGPNNGKQEANDKDEDFRNLRPVRRVVLS